MMIALQSNAVYLYIFTYNANVQASKRSKRANSADEATVRRARQSNKDHLKVNHERSEMSTSSPFAIAPATYSSTSSNRCEYSVLKPNIRLGTHPIIFLHQNSCQIFVLAGQPTIETQQPPHPQFSLYSKKCLTKWLDFILGIRLRSISKHKSNCIQQHPCGMRNSVGNSKSSTIWQVEIGLPAFNSRL